MKKKSLLILPFLLATSTLLPIRQQTAHRMSVAGTIGAGALTFGLSRSLLLSTCAAGISYYLMSSFMHRFSPKGRFKIALEKATDVSHNPFAITSYGKDQSFISDLQDYYTDQYWLISAHSEIDRLINLAHRALELLDLARKDSENDFHLLQECAILQKKVQVFLINLTAALRRIKNHEDFTAQRASYNQILLEKERLTIEREKAHAYYLQARAQQSRADAQWSRGQGTARCCCDC